jgi:hypothetical protein
MISITHVLIRCGTTLSFSVVIILLEVAVCVSVSVGGITAHAVTMLHTPAGLYLVGILMTGHTLSIYVNDDIE